MYLSAFDFLVEQDESFTSGPDLPNKFRLCDLFERYHEVRILRLEGVHHFLLTVLDLRSDQAGVWSTYIIINGDQDRDVLEIWQARKIPRRVFKVGGICVADRLIKGWEDVDFGTDLNTLDSDDTRRILGVQKPCHVLGVLGMKGVLRESDGCRLCVDLAGYSE